MQLRCSMLLGVSSMVVLFGIAYGASDQAVRLRGENTLSPFSPPESFLAGNFVADEAGPNFIFGKVKDFVSSRSCPTTWLMEEEEKKRIDSRTPQSGPIEYTLFLEEDCPSQVTYFVFVDRSQAGSAQWIEWRKQFHKSKTEPYYGAVKTSLDKAAQDGFTVNGELRFVETSGKLLAQKPEDLLTDELKFQPIYDLKQGKAVPR
jgi:hypothetical protein